MPTTTPLVEQLGSPTSSPATSPGSIASSTCPIHRASRSSTSDGSTTNLPGTDPAGAGNAQGNWEVEEALDVEWAHAIAPGATIILVECNSNSGADLFMGVTTAASLPGVSVVSMSWGAGEYHGEENYDKDFTTPGGHQGVTFVASTGDSGLPALSRLLTQRGRRRRHHPDSSERRFPTRARPAWSGSGGGTSPARPSRLQRGVQSTGKRTIPDVSFDADPTTGVAVYDSYNDTTATGPGSRSAAPAWLRRRGPP